MTLAALVLLPSTVSAEQRKPVVIDGDSVSVGIIEWRLKGCDTPEISKGRARCEAERRLGFVAKRRLQQLIDGAAEIEMVDSGKDDKYDRSLGNLMLDGKDACATLVSECLARPYEGGRRKSWCWWLDDPPCAK